ncbi:MAG: hypothetical protein JHC32_09750, partial [Candidatus Aminicenantes bacterium]|nr:hypothetical protein [Candidatus Aminicenantes bacterium]
MSCNEKILACALAILSISGIFSVGVNSQEKAPGQNYLLVRVFENNNFLSGLPLSEFELLENGQPQKLEGLLEFH